MNINLCYYLLFIIIILIILFIICYSLQRNETNYYVIEKLSYIEADRLTVLSAASVDKNACKNYDHTYSPRKVLGSVLEGSYRFNPFYW